MSTSAECYQERPRREPRSGGRRVPAAISIAWAARWPHPPHEAAGTGRISSSRDSAESAYGGAGGSSGCGSWCWLSLLPSPRASSASCGPAGSSSTTSSRRGRRPSSRRSSTCRPRPSSSSSTATRQSPAAPPSKRPRLWPSATSPRRRLSSASSRTRSHPARFRPTVGPRTTSSSSRTRPTIHLPPCPGSPPGWPIRRDSRSSSPVAPPSTATSNRSRNPTSGGAS